MNLPISVHLILLAVAVALLWKGADWFVDAAARVARRFKVSDLVIGLTLVGFGTSAPEFAVSIAAAIRGQSDLAVANVVGSNNFNLGFVLGAAALIHPLVTSRTLLFRDGFFLLGAVLLVTFFLFDGQLGRLEGTCLLGLLIGYLVFLFYKKEALDEAPADGSATLRDGPLLMAGLAMVIGGAQLLVYSASHIALTFGVSEWLVGVTIVAAGTSAPEMVTSLNASRKGRYGMSAGNLIGSDLFNMLGVLGLAAIIRPLGTSANAPFSMAMVVGMVALVLIFIRTGWKVSRLEGGLLLAVCLLRWVVETLL